MTNRRKIFLNAPQCLATALPVLSLATVGCSDQSSNEKDSFDIGMVTFAGYAPLYLAKEKGFFSNLDVESRRIESIPSIRAATVTGRLDAYIATPDIALDSNIAPPGRAIWVLLESAGGDGVVVPGDIENIEGLRGQRVAGEPGLPPCFITLYLMDRHGLSLSDVQF